MPYAFAEIAFTPSVQAQQHRMGSGGYARLLSAERSGGDRLGPIERSFIEQIDGFYQATVSETGWPYVQFRGGASGFLRVLNDRTIAYADLRGNRQYITLGNLTRNDRVCLILMDYANAMRLKIWGQVEIADPDDDVAADIPQPATAQTERVILIHLAAFDWNCPQHIPQRLDADEVAARIEALEAENAALRAALSGDDHPIPPAGIPPASTP